MVATNCLCGYKLPLLQQIAYSLALAATILALVATVFTLMFTTCSVHDMFTPRRGHTRLLLFCDTMALHIPTLRNNYHSVSTDLDTTAHLFFSFFFLLFFLLARSLSILCGTKYHIVK